MSDPGRAAARDGRLAGDWADADYLRLRAGPGGDEELREVVARSGRAFGVVCDDEDHPLRLLTPDGPVPLAIIDAGTPMREVIAGDLADDIAELLNGGGPAIIVTSDGRVTGALTPAALSDYLADHARHYSPLLGDGQLHGPAAARQLRLTCAACGTLNVVTFYVAGRTMCTRRHLLTLPWD